jgi:hypothetical protein
LCLPRHDLGGALHGVITDLRRRCDDGAVSALRHVSRYLHRNVRVAPRTHRREALKGAASRDRPDRCRAPSRARPSRFRSCPVSLTCATSSTVSRAARPPRAVLMTAVATPLRWPRSSMGWAHHAIFGERPRHFAKLMWQFQRVLGADVNQCLDHHALCLVWIHRGERHRLLNAAHLRGLAAPASSGNAVNAAGRGSPAITTPARLANLRPQATRCRSSDSPSAIRRTG